MKIVASSIFLFLIFQNFSNGFILTKSKGCLIDINKDLSKTPPLFIQQNSNQFVRSSDNKGSVSFKTGESMLLSCAGSKNLLSLKGTGKSEAIATCIAGIEFKISGSDYNISDITCQQWPQSLHQKGGECLTKKNLFNIGFQTSKGFINLIDVCHDIKTHNTYYTKFILRPDAAGAQQGVARSSWVTGGLYKGLNMDNLYKREIQRVTIGNILGDQKLGEEYVDLKNDYFLAKGHLVAKSDFMYGTQHRATFFYSNAAPQWQTFNGGNWNSIENDVRAFAGRYKKDLEVYTGTYGDDTLPNKYGKNIKLTLNGKGLIPVPMIFWKIVYSPHNNRGVVFLGVNSPYVKETDIEKDVLCNDICHEIKWLTWSQKDIKKGYSYCCDVNDFVKKFPNVPKIKVSGILK